MELKRKKRKEKASAVKALPGIKADISPKDITIK